MSQDLRYLLILSLSSSKSILLLTLLLQRLRGNGHPDAEKEHRLLTSSLRTPKVFVKEFSYFLMPCHQHCLGVNLLVQR